MEEGLLDEVGDGLIGDGRLLVELVVCAARSDGLEERFLRSHFG